MRSSISSLIRTGLALLLLHFGVSGSWADQTDALSKLGQRLSDSLLLDGGSRQTAPPKSIYATGAAASLADGLGFTSSADVREQNQETLARIRDQRSGLAEQRLATEEMRSRLSEQKWKLTDMRSRMNDQKSQMAEMRSRLNDQRSQLGDMRSRMSDQQSRLADMRSRMSDQKGQLGDMRSRMSDQQSRLADIRSRMSDQKGRLADMRSRMSDQQSRLADMRSRMSDQFKRQSFDGAARLQSTLENSRRTIGTMHQIGGMALMANYGGDFQPGLSLARAPYQSALRTAAERRVELSTVQTFERNRMRTTVLGENMRERVVPFAEKTGARTLPRTSKEAWDSMTTAQQYKFNDGALRSRIKEGDSFRYIGRDAFRDPAERKRFDLTGTELLRLQDRGVPYQAVPRSQVQRMLPR